MPSMQKAFHIQESNRAPTGVTSRAQAVVGQFKRTEKTTCIMEATTTWLETDTSKAPEVSGAQGVAPTNPPAPASGGSWPRHCSVNSVSGALPELHGFCRGLLDLDLDFTQANRSICSADCEPCRLIGSPCCCSAGWFVWLMLTRAMLHVLEGEASA